MRSVSNAFKLIEKSYEKLKLNNKNYKLGDIYNWDYISEKYLRFLKINFKMKRNRLS